MIFIGNSLFGNNHNESINSTLIWKNYVIMKLCNYILVYRQTMITNSFLYSFLFTYIRLLLSKYLFWSSVVTNFLFFFIFFIIITKMNYYTSTKWTVIQVLIKNILTASFTTNKVKTRVKHYLPRSCEANYTISILFI